jgi:hypothetical protein
MNLKINKLIYYLNNNGFISEANLMEKIILKFSSKSSKISNSTIIYCDMDGVLVNFEQQAYEDIRDILQKGKEHELIGNNPKLHEAYENVAKAIGHKIDLDNPSVKKLMFKVISQNPGKWFHQLSPLKGGDEVWRFINNLNYVVKILSAGVSGKKGALTAEDGKKEWVKDNLTPQPDEVIVAEKSSDKKNWAINADGSSNILIDDKHSNIESWESAGGIGILHTPGDSASTIKRLQEILDV